MRVRLISLIVLTCISLFVLIGCNTDAKMVSYNLAREAEQFRINRRIVFLNGITDTYLLSIQGFCSIETQTRQKQLEVTCKTSETSYKKHHLGLSDNVSYFSEQLSAAGVSASYYKVIFKPKSIIPDIEISN